MKKIATVIPATLINTVAWAQSGVALNEKYLDGKVFVSGFPYVCEIKFIIGGTYDLGCEPNGGFTGIKTSGQWKIEKQTVVLLARTKEKSKNPTSHYWYLVQMGTVRAASGWMYGESLGQE